MSQLTALKQDVRREVGKSAEIQGYLDELIRLKGRIESGELTQGELARELEDFQDYAYELAGILERAGAYGLADEVEEMGTYGPRDGFNMPDTEGLGGFQAAANQILDN